MFHICRIKEKCSISLSQITITTHQSQLLQRSYIFSVTSHVNSTSFNGRLVTQINKIYQSRVVQQISNQREAMHELSPSAQSFLRGQIRKKQSANVTRAFYIFLIELIRAHICITFSSTTNQGNARSLRTQTVTSNSHIYLQLLLHPTYH